MIFRVMINDRRSLILERLTIEGDSPVKIFIKER